MLLKRIAVVVGALAMTSLATPGTVSAGRMIERPLHMTYTAEYQDEVTHTCDSGEQANLLLGEGVGSLVGRFDLRIEACVLATSPLTGDVTGTAYYTAANGDLLAFVFDGEYVVNLDTLTLESVLPAVDAFGTGRFANVELGSGTGAAVDFNPLNPDFTNSGMSYGYVTGAIVYDASARAAR
jgi:hypothetical protein